MTSPVCGDHSKNDFPQITSHQQNLEERFAAMVVDVMPREDTADRILPPPNQIIDRFVPNEEEETKEGVMKIIRANIKRITEEVNKIDYDRLKRSQIQHFNRYGCFSC